MVCGLLLQLLPDGQGVVRGGADQDAALYCLPVGRGQGEKRALVETRNILYIHRAPKSSHFCTGKTGHPKG
jgi:hypothetical protein